MKVNEAIFRDYDIRGIVGEDIGEEFAKGFGKAFGTYLWRKGTKDVLVGYDARESSPSYFDAAVDGLASTGVHVIKIGMVTSPMMYWARKFWRIDGGLVITASHNPPEFNGFKCASGGGALYGQEIQKLKELMISEDFVKGIGKIEEKPIVEDYFADIKLKISLARPRLARRLSVIVDCGNSTAGPFAPVIIERLGVKVERLFCDIDPTFPNHPPDPVDPRAYPTIKEKIKNSKFDLGLLFDGDGDRLGVVDSQGNIVRGDQVTALCARRILGDKPGSLIIFELQCSKSAIDDVRAHGGKTLLSRVGHSYIEEALAREEAELAGETSGHIFFADRWYGFDDAIYAACRLLEYVAESGKSLGELVESMPKYVSTAQTRIAAPEERKFAIVSELKDYFAKKGYKMLTIDGVRLEWDDGWAVVRASNTQPQLTLRAEAKDEKRLGQIKRIMEEALLPYNGEGVELEWGKVG